MVEQYPHTITATIEPVMVQNQETGNFEAPEGEDTQFSSECRAVPNGEGKMLTDISGSKIDYAYTVYMPVQETRLKLNEEVEIHNGETLIAKGKVKRHVNGQLNSRLWL